MPFSMQAWRECVIAVETDRSTETGGSGGPVRTSEQGDGIGEWPHPARGPVPGQFAFAAAIRRGASSRR